MGQSVKIFWLAWGVCAPVCECVMIAMKHFASLPWQTAVRPPAYLSKRLYGLQPTLANGCTAFSLPWQTAVRPPRLPWQTAVRPPQADQSGRTDQPLPEGVHSRRH